MKQIGLLLISTALAVLSCSKTEIYDPTPDQNGMVTVMASINPLKSAKTKTDYDIDEEKKEASPKWTGVEKISRLTWSGSMSYKIYSCPSADAGETTMAFTGTYDANQTDYAAYPSRDETNGAKIDWYSDNANTLHLWLGETITYNPSAQLKNIVPMVGKLNGSGTFVFNVIAGILAVRITHIPPSANKVTITTDNHPISGGFRYSSSDIGSWHAELDAIHTNGLLLGQHRTSKSYSNSKSFTIPSALDFNTTYTFYFPVPSGILNEDNDGIAPETFTVGIYEGETLLYSKTTNKDIVISNAVITRLPVIELPSNSVSMQVGGTSTDIKFKMTAKSSLVSYVKAYAASTADAAAEGISASGTTISSLNTLTSIAGAYSTSGQYFIAYQGYDSSDNPLEGTSGAYAVYYLSDDDNTRFCGGQLTLGTGFCFSVNKSSTGAQRDDMTVTFAASDDPTRGNIKLLEFDGFSYNAAVTEATLGRIRALMGDSNYTTFTSGAFSAGSAMYGVYNASITNGTNNLVFSSTDSSPFFNYGSYKYRLLSYDAADDSGYGMNSNTLEFRLNYNTGGEGYYVSSAHRLIRVRVVSQASYNYARGFSILHYDTFE